MEKTIKNWLNILLFTFVITVLTFSIAYNSEVQISSYMMILATLIITSATLRYLFFYESKKYYKLGIAGIVFDGVIIYLLSLSDKYGIVDFLYIGLIGEAIIFYKLFLSLIISGIGFSAYLFIRFFAKGSEKFSNLVPNIMASVLSVLFIVIIMGIAKYVISQHERLQEKMDELELAHSKLRDWSDKVQQLAAVKERNRIAEEVHDTIGHTLTTVLVELEATKCLIEKDPKRSKEKLGLAQEQVRAGLNSIQKSISQITTETQEFKLEEEVEKLIKEVVKHTGIEVLCQMQENIDLSNEKKTLIYKVLKEGLTNGIRHGKATKFEFVLSQIEDGILCSLSDDGKADKVFEYGFGLNSIKEKVYELNGIMSAEINRSGGFDLKIRL